MTFDSKGCCSECYENGYWNAFDTIAEHFRKQGKDKELVLYEILALQKEGIFEVTQEVQRGLEFNPGDRLVIERGTHAGWCVHRDRHPNVMGDSAFFTDASDMLEYLKGQVQQ